LGSGTVPFTPVAAESATESDSAKRRSRSRRRGYKDLSGVLDKLREYGCEVWSHQEEWLSTIGPSERS
jgi:hypothetical protein